MPNYNYECSKCEKVWEEIHPITDRDAPTKLPCPFCKTKETVIKSWKDCAPGLGSDWTLTPDKATGGRWSAVMNKIKRGLPERTRKRFDKGNNSKGTRWH
jgi:putative FmdB family regulatory protein